jgi:hypothetical protein
MNGPRAIRAIAIGLAAVLTFSAPGFAQESSSNARLKVGEPAKTSTRGVLALSATLTTAEGKPASDRQVDFYQQVEFFGDRDALLGTAPTDSTGTAILLYQPATRGKQTIIARFGGGGSLQKAEGNVTIDVREVAELFEEEHASLDTVRRWLPLGLITVVLIVWGILIGTLLSTCLGIAAVGRSASRPSHAMHPEAIVGGMQQAGEP